MALSQQSRVRNFTKLAGRIMLVLAVSIPAFCPHVANSDERDFAPWHETALADIAERAEELKQVNQGIWKFAEVDKTYSGNIRRAQIGLC